MIRFLRGHLINHDTPPEPQLTRSKPDRPQRREHLLHCSRFSQKTTDFGDNRKKTTPGVLLVTLSAKSANNIRPSNGSQLTASPRRPLPARADAGIQRRSIRLRTPAAPAASNCPAQHHQRKLDNAVIHGRIHQLRPILRNHVCLHSTIGWLSRGIGVELEQTGCQPDDLLSFCSTNCLAGSYRERRSDRPGRSPRKPPEFVAVLANRPGLLAGRDTSIRRCVFGEQEMVGLDLRRIAGYGPPVNLGQRMDSPDFDSCAW